MRRPTEGIGMTTALTFDDVVLIDGTGAPPVARGRVVVEDGLVVAVEHAAGNLNGPHVVRAAAAGCCQGCGTPTCTMASAPAG